jgi:hypothetical protein
MRVGGGFDLPTSSRDLVTEDKRLSWHSFQAPRPLILLSITLSYISFHFCSSTISIMAEFTIKDEDLNSLKGKVAIVTGVLLH